MAEWKELYWEDGTGKELLIACDSGDLRNSDIIGEKFSLEEAVCDEKSLRFGGCIASTLKITIINTGKSYKGVKMVVREILNGDTENPFTFGTYTVDSDKLSSDRQSRELVAYDRMRDITSGDMTEWYNGLFFPLTVKKLRDAFFAYWNLKQQDVVLPNDNVYVMKNNNAAGVFGGDIIKDICEINGCFGRIGRSGVFEYVFLPADSADLGRNRYISETHEDFETPYYNQLIISQSTSESDYYHGSGKNTYLLTTRILQFTKEGTAAVADRMFRIISGISYVPVNIKAIGNPCVECGSRINISTKESRISSYVFGRQLTGVHALKDTIEARGLASYERKPGTKDKILQAINGQISELKGSYYYMYVFTNAGAISVDSAERKTISDMEFTAYKTGNVFFNLEASIDVDTEVNETDETVTFNDTEITVTYIINDVETAEYHPTETYMDGKHILRLMYYLMVESNTVTHLVVRIRVTGGRVNIGKNCIKATIFGQGLNADQNNDGNIRIEQVLPTMQTGRPGGVSVAAVGSRLDITSQIPAPADITEMIPMIAVAGPGMVQVTGITDTVTTGGLE